MESRQSGFIYFGAALVFLTAGGVSLFMYNQGGGPVAEAPTDPVKTVAPQTVEPANPTDSVLLKAGEEQVSLTWSELGAKGDALDRTALQNAITKLSLGRAARNARLDMENNEIIKEQAGLVLDKPGAAALVESAYLTGKREIALPMIEVLPSVTVESLGIDDISHVLGHFETKFKVRDSSRNYNLKLAASKLNGYIMKPGEEISFNEVVGARDHDQGYKIAGVIQSGQLVDGLAGGTCQISSTLYGASFFAGLNITSQTPHSRPSSYVRAGLDATVVYPVRGYKGVDLKIKNDYDFPVVIHFTVARGKSQVRILGKKRPWDKVIFERKVTKRISFDTVTREDNSMPVASSTVDQPGYPGYKLIRYRKYVKGGKVVKTEKWPTQYRPVTEYIRIGTNPNPNLPVPKSKKKKNLSVVSGSGRLEQ